jgi:hypothetical protein
VKHVLFVQGSPLRTSQIGSWRLPSYAASLDALSELAETIEMLFYVEEGVDASVAAMRKARKTSSAHGASGQDTLCPVAESPTVVTF